MNKAFRDKFIEIERAVSRTNGAFRLFALVSPTDNSRGWDVLASAEWGDGDRSGLMMKAIAVEIQDRLTKDDFWNLGRIAVVNTSSEIVTTLTRNYRAKDEALYLRSVEFNDMDYRMYLITCSTGRSQTEASDLVVLPGVSTTTTPPRPVAAGTIN